MTETLLPQPNIFPNAESLRDRVKGLRNVVTTAAGNFWESVIAQKEQLAMQFIDDVNLMKAGIAPWDTKTGQQILANPLTWMAVATLMPRAMDGFDNLLEALSKPAHVPHNIMPNNFHGIGPILNGPGQTEHCQYTVQSGDTFYKIARAHSIPAADLAQMNGSNNPSSFSTILPGREFNVPCSPEPPAPPITPTIAPTETPIPMTDLNTTPVAVSTVTAEQYFDDLYNSPAREFNLGLDDVVGVAIVSAVAAAVAYPAIKNWIEKGNQAQAAAANNTLLLATGEYNVAPNQAEPLILADPNVALALKVTGPYGDEILQVILGKIYNYHNYFFRTYIKDGIATIEWRDPNKQPIPSLPPKAITHNNVEQIIPLRAMLHSGDYPQEQKQQGLISLADALNDPDGSLVNIGGITYSTIRYAPDYGIIELVDDNGNTFLFDMKLNDFIDD